MPHGKLDLRGGWLAGLFDLLLDLAAKFQGMGHLVKWLRSAAGADDDNGAVTEEPAESGFADFDAFHFVEEHFDGFASGDAGLNDDPAVGDGHFRGTAAKHADGNDYSARNKQESGDTFPQVKSVGRNSGAAGECVEEQEQRGKIEQESRQHKVPERDDPVEARLVNHGFAGNQVCFDVAHGKRLSQGLRVLITEGS